MYKIQQMNFHKSKHLFENNTVVKVTNFFYLFLQVTLCLTLASAKHTPKG